MGARYLVDLADVCRSTGYPVVEVDGWQSRARGSGGYDSGQPGHVLVHHTASGPSSDGWPDVNYMCFGHQDAPCGNLYIARGGDIYVMAAGAANTNGSGHDPCGIVPDDGMNSRSIAIEAGNDGVGEPWPTAQQDSYATLVARLCETYGIGVDRVHAHHEWAPDRKIDPAGPSWWSHGLSETASWNMDSFRGDVTVRLGATPGPIPPTTGDDMAEKILVRTTDGMPWVTDFASYATQITEDQAARGRDMRGYSVGPDGGPWPLDEQDSDLMVRLRSGDF
jgi:hypothetical protein